MADYWVSNPRHYCEVCKCWFGDNKISVEFHENGRRHKANVERQLRESRKRASVKDKEAIKLSETLEQIEKAAMASYQRDQAGLPPAKRVATGTAAVPLTTEMIQFEQNKIRKEMTKKLEQKKKEMDEQDKRRIKQEQEATSSSPWQQLTSPEGYPYYYNSLTGVSQWEVPSGVIPVNQPTYSATTGTTDGNVIVKQESESDNYEQHENQSDNKHNENQSNDKGNQADKKASVTSTKPSKQSPTTTTSYGTASYGAASYGATPYGAWTTVAVREQMQMSVSTDDTETEPNSPSAGKSRPPPAGGMGKPDDCSSDEEEHVFKEKTTPTTSNLSNVKVEPGTFKGFGFKKKQKRSNIKERTSDW